MELTVHWSDLWTPAVLMALSFVLSRWTGRWRRRRQSAAVRSRARTHWEWLPFMFGLVAAIAELARLLEVPDTWLPVADAAARVFAITTVFMVARAVFLLFMRGTRLLFRHARHGGPGGAESGG
ncbi:hypothetical protein [Streptomyces cavernae]|uniref:hypothetical protein n=1 Tax=Streptomyces cavernae TaxID=2259034 RepID=UPI000FEB78DC|nr:hypothetical protein [Streptomyces cavernae]